MQIISNNGQNKIDKFCNFFFENNNQLTYYLDDKKNIPGKYNYCLL